MTLALTVLVAASLTGCATAASSAKTEIAAEGLAVPVAVDSMSPTTGSLSGGDVVTLTGTGLDAVSAIVFDGVSTPVTVVDDSTVTAVVPHAAAYVPGSVDVDVVADDATAATFSYEYDVLTGVDRQLQYAFEHWDDYNLDEYGDFNESGGDCQNFVSQTLIARGWTPTDDWYNDAGEDWADAFVYAPTFDEWIADAGVGATRLSFDEIDQVKIGDIVMLDWNDNDSPDHVQIVSGVEVVDGVTHILMVGHNLDDDFRDLQTAITVDHPGGAAWFWSLPAA